MSSGVRSYVLLCIRDGTLRFCNATFERPFELFDFLGGGTLMTAMLCGYYPTEIRLRRGASAATGKDEGGEL
ncbi:MAG TPA: hypothetical protein VGV15_04020 [Terriglobales bacterium]|nr:hypothetical protein [Terriglobales bacterium]